MLKWIKKLHKNTCGSLQAVELLIIISGALVVAYLTYAVVLEPLQALHINTTNSITDTSRGR